MVLASLQASALVATTGLAFCFLRFLILTSKGARHSSRHGPQVENRASRRELTFAACEGRPHLVVILGKTCAKSRCEVHAFVFMPNHLPAPSTADRFSTGGRDAAA